MASNFPNDGPGVPPGGPGYPLGGGPSTPPPRGAIIPAGMVERMKNILLTPKAEWPRIDVEPMTARGVFLSWAVPLAAIGPAAGFIGQQLFGVNLIVVHYKPPLLSSLVSAVLSYVAALIGVWVLTLVIEALAPTFGSVKNRDQAMKVAAFSYTAAWIAGILQIIPALGIIGGLLGLYSFYLLWLGMPILMKTPADKQASYVIVSIVAAVLVYLIVGAVVGTVTTRMTFGAIPGVTAANDAGGTLSVAGVGAVDIGKLNAAAAKMEAAANSVQQNARIGNGATTAVAGDVLQGMLPASVGAFTRSSIESSSGAAGGIGGSQAKGTYIAGDQSFTLSIADTGAMGQLATLGGALNMQSNKQTATGYEKTAMQGGNIVSEKWDNAEHSGSYSTMVGSRFMVEAEGTAPSIDPLRAAVAAVDQGRLSTIARP